MKSGNFASAKYYPKKKPQDRASRKQRKKRVLKVNYSAVTAERGATIQSQLGEMKQKLQEERTAQTMIQAQLQVESAALAEMEGRFGRTLV
jgi:hypothetical protein